MTYGFPVPSQWILGFLWREFCNLAFVDLFRFPYSQPYARRISLVRSIMPSHRNHTDSSPKVLHQRFRLLDLGRVYLAPDYGAKRHLCPQLLRDRQGQGRFAGPWTPS